MTSTLLRRLYSKASCSFLSPLPMRLKDLTTLIPWIVSKTASISAVCDFCVSPAMTADFFSIADTAHRYNAMPTSTISPMRQSKRRISSAKTTVVISPPRMFTSTIGTMLSMLPTTVVHTPDNCPRLLSLKKPMGTLFSRFAIEMRRSAAIK